MKKAFLFIIIIGYGFSLSAQGYNRFLEGNSLQQVQPLFTKLAKDAGYVNDKTTTVGAAGTPVDWCWENMYDDFYEKLAKNAPYDIIEVQPFIARQAPEDEGDAIIQIYTAALEKSPDSKLLVYYTWVNTPREHASLGEWEGAITEYIDSTLVPMVDIIEQTFPDKPVYVVPVTHAILALNDSIKAGKLPRFSSIDDIFHDGIHMNANGNYFNACVHYAATYEKSPEGLPHEYTVNPAIYTQDTDLTDDEAAIFQRTAWDVVRNHPRTLVTKTPRPKNDTQAPSKPAGLQATNVRLDAIDLSWNASSDNGIVGEYFVYAYPASNSFGFVDSLYSTYRWVHTAVSTEATVTGSTHPPIQPGVTYKVFMRARDAEFNLSPSSDTITVEVPESVQGGERKFDFGSGTSPVADGYTQIAPKQLYRADRGYGFDGKMHHDVADDTTVSSLLLRDRIESYVGLSDFLVDVPNGEYVVTVYVGGASDIKVVAEDVVKLENLTIPSGEPITGKTFNVTVDDNQLNIKISKGRGKLKVWGIEIEEGSTKNVRLLEHGSRKHQMEFILHPGFKQVDISATGENITQLDIINLQGRVLYSKKTISNKVTIPGKLMRSGMYVLRLHFGKVIVEKKLLMP